MKDIVYNFSDHLEAVGHVSPKLQAQPAYLSYDSIVAAGSVRELAARMYTAYSAGLAGVIVPLRSSIQRENPFFAFDTMPAYSEVHRLFVAKIGAVIPQQDPSKKSVHALVVAFSATSGRPIAIFDGEAITNLKCAAVAGMVTDLCSKDDAKVLCMIGSGVQAFNQLRAVVAVRALTQVKIYSRNHERMKLFLQKCQAAFPEIQFSGCHSAEQAALDADIVCTATTACVPLLPATSLQRTGLHINCFGNHTPQSREIPIEVLESNSVLIVEDLQTALEEAGEVHRGAITLDRLGSLAPAMLKQKRTIFSSTGHAFLDLLTTEYLIEKLGL